MSFRAIVVVGNERGQVGVGVGSQELYDAAIKLGFDRRKLYPQDLSREDFFLVLGRHNPHKNISRILQALSILKVKNNRIIFFIFIQRQ